MPKTFRESDNATEKAVSDFLDEYFYPKITSDWKRYTDKATQMTGVDVSFSINQLTNILVDEKCLAHYINKNIPTAAFEIDFYSSSGDLIEGWLFDINKITQYYLIIWIKANRDKNITKNDITELDCLLLSRERLLKYLNSENINRDIIKEISKRIRATRLEGHHDKDNKKPYYYYLTLRLQERPLNIVIRKNKLIELAYKRFIVTTNNITTM